MTLIEFDNYINAFLRKEDFSKDISLNGIQIQNSGPDSKEIKKLAFAVDACEATAKKAVQFGADLLFVLPAVPSGRLIPPSRLPAPSPSSSVPPLTASPLCTVT